MVRQDFSPIFEPPAEWEASDDYAPLAPEDEELRQRVHQRLIQEMDLRTVESQGKERAREAVQVAARSLVTEAAHTWYGERKEQVIRRIVDDAVGMGPLEPLIGDSSISEIMVNAPDEIYFERDGIIYLSALRFRDSGQIMVVVDRIISPLGRRIDESSPYVDARLPDGSRVNVIIPPLVPRGPTLTIRKLRPPNIEGKNEVTQRDLVRNALRMRPDRIVVGEVRGVEAFDMMQAMNTGHEGSLTTVHSNSTRDALARIENMILMAGLDLPVRAIREQVASGLHLVVQLARFSDGRRRVTCVSEITGMEGEIVTMQDIFLFKQTGVDKTGRIQ